MSETARVCIPFDDELITLADNDSVLCIRPPADLPQDIAERPALIAEQGFKPIFDALNARGVDVAANVTDGEFGAVIMFLTRNRAENMANFARACRLCKDTGVVVVNGNKTDGVDSMVKAVKKIMPVEGVISKSHGKVFWVEPQSAPLEWETAARPKPNKFGYVTAPGMFSPDKIDKGSTLLAEHFDKSIKGRVADLGAAWGYLSKELLNRVENIELLDIFEAEHSALEAAKLNVVDDRVSFHWQDVPSLEKPSEAYHTVVSNPPFHQTRAADPSLGAGFIATAARIIKGSGQFLMVANRQLPYEAALDKNFRSWDMLHQDASFKVIRARNPRSK